MTFFKVLIFVLGLILICESSSLLDHLTKCNSKDSECHKNNFKTILKEIPKNGIPELGIPSIDPVELKDINVSIDNIISMKVIEGTAKGVKNCIVHKFDINLENLRVYMELTCTLIIKGKYEVSSDSDIVKSIVGGPVDGNGNGKVKIDQIKININFPIEVEKRGSDTFLKSDIKKYQYTFDVLGRVTFAANNVRLGDKESSKEVVGLLNENWEIIVKSFGNHFFDIAMKIVYNLIKEFLARVPTSYYIEEDLSSYAH